jgi:hypothetical protein
VINARYSFIGDANYRFNRYKENNSMRFNLIPVVPRPVALKHKAIAINIKFTYIKKPIASSRFGRWLPGESKE